MGQIWDFLLANPILFFVIAAWVAGAIGNAVRTRGVQQKREQARSERREAPTQSSAGQSRTGQSGAGLSGADQRRADQRSADQDRADQRREAAQMREEDRRRAPTQTQTRPPPVPSRPPAADRAPDEIAAEMRRILGLDVDLEPKPPQRAEPIRREAVRKPAEPERPPTPLSTSAATRRLEKHIDPHVGEAMSHRKSERSRVGVHDREWGTLGGRLREKTVEVDTGPVRRLVDLTDLTRALLGAEILGPPLALRPDDKQRMF